MYVIIVEGKGYFKCPCSNERRKKESSRDLTVFQAQQSEAPNPTKHNVKDKEENLLKKHLE
jgi:hypothetical protein